VRGSGEAGLRMNGFFSIGFRWGPNEKMPQKCEARAT